MPSLVQAQPLLKQLHRHRRSKAILGGFKPTLKPEAPNRSLNPHRNPLSTRRQLQPTLNLRSRSHRRARFKKAFDAALGPFQEVSGEGLRLQEL